MLHKIKSKLTPIFLHLDLLKMVNNGQLDQQLDSKVIKEAEKGALKARIVIEELLEKEKIEMKQWAKYHGL